MKQALILIIGVFVCHCALNAQTAAPTRDSTEDLFAFNRVMYQKAYRKGETHKMWQYYERCLKRSEAALKLNAQGKLEASSDLLSYKCLSCMNFYEKAFSETNNITAEISLEVLIDNNYNLGQLETAKDYFLILNYFYPNHRFDKPREPRSFSVYELYKGYKYRYLISRLYIAPAIFYGFGAELGVITDYKFLSVRPNGWMIRSGYTLNFYQSLSHEIYLQKTIIDPANSNNTYYILDDFSRDLYPVTTILRHRFLWQVYIPIKRPIVVKKLQLFLGVNFDVLANPGKLCSEIYLQNDTVSPTKICNPNLKREKTAFSLSFGFRKIWRNNTASTFTFSPVFRGDLTKSSKEYLKMEGFEPIGSTRNFGFSLSFYHEFGQFEKIWWGQHFFHGKKYSPQ